MTAAEFIAWAVERPETETYELVAGEVIAMSPERLGHVRAKQVVFAALQRAFAASGLPCEVLIDGLGVQVDETTIYIPDVLVRCGPPLRDDTVVIRDPTILVEVLSPSTRSVDTSLKLTEYFRIPSVQHYLILRADTRTVIHHWRDESGAVASRILGDVPLTLDPPGIELRDLFG
jgi:Uma2 family endonuclease